MPAASTTFPIHHTNEIAQSEARHGQEMGQLLAAQRVPCYFERQDGQVEGRLPHPPESSSTRATIPSITATSSWAATTAPSSSSPTRPSIRPGHRASPWSSESSRSRKRRASAHDADSAPLGPKASSLYRGLHRPPLPGSRHAPRPRRALGPPSRQRCPAGRGPRGGLSRWTRFSACALPNRRRPETAAVDPLFAAEIEALVAERGAAKKAKDWARADAIRAQLKSKGVLLEDGPAGTPGSSNELGRARS